MGKLIDMMKGAFAALYARSVVAPARSVLRFPDQNGTVLLMGAGLRGEGITSKTVSIFHDNATRGLSRLHGVVILLDYETGAPKALFNGGTLTALRTGAASGAATDLLAPRHVEVAAIIGCGTQARTQVMGIDAVRDFVEIRIASRRPSAAETFVSSLQSQVRAKLTVAASIRGAVLDADVVCLATNSATPVLKGAWLKPGSHVNGVGSFTLEMREADGETVSRSRIFIDAFESALAEAGDLVIAEKEGLTRRSEWEELGKVVTNVAAGRRTPQEITFFKSVGHAVQDTAAAVLALQAAVRDNLGQVIDL